MTEFDTVGYDDSSLEKYKVGFDSFLGAARAFHLGGKLEQYEEVLGFFSPNFYATAFKGNADFWESEFRWNANFARATFEAPARYSRARFEAATYFAEASFSQVYFDETAFGSPALFESVAFRAEANFLEATFNGKADFYRTSFEDDVRFYGFDTFNSEQGVIFRQARIREPAVFLFDSVRLRPSWFTDINDP